MRAQRARQVTIQKCSQSAAMLVCCQVFSKTRSEPLVDSSTGTATSLANWKETLAAVQAWPRSELAAMGLQGVLRKQCCPAHAAVRECVTRALRMQIGWARRGRRARRRVRARPRCAHGWRARCAISGAWPRSSGRCRQAAGAWRCAACWPPRPRPPPPAPCAACALLPSDAAAPTTLEHCLSPDALSAAELGHCKRLAGLPCVSIKQVAYFPSVLPESACADRCKDR